VSVPFKNVLKAATDLLSVNSKDCARFIPFASSSFNAGANSSRLVIGLPSCCARSPEESASFKSIFRVDVAAVDASKPELANVPKSAVVFHIQCRLSGGNS